MVHLYREILKTEGEHIKLAVREFCNFSRGLSIFLCGQSQTFCDAFKCDTGIDSSKCMVHPPPPPCHLSSSCVKSKIANLFTNPHTKHFTFYIKNITYVKDYHILFFVINYLHRM